MKKEEKKDTKKKEVVKRKDASLHEKKKFNPIGLIITALLIGICAILAYHFLGLIEAGVVAVGLFFVFLIGYFLDKPKTKSKRRKVFKIILVFILIIIILALLAGCGFIYYIVKNAPDFKEELLKEKESTIFYDSEGREYAKVGKELRENIEYDQLSEAFIDALIAVEDSRFFQHNGFDLMRFVKAAAGQAMGQDSGGGSTLTMQLSKNTFTSSEATGFAGIVRKFTDIYISIFQIERNYTKEQIIEFYANNHPLGGIIFGVQEASKYFFNKDAKDLNISEAAIIAGMYQAPSSYNPFLHPQASQKRRNTVLYQMEKHGYITSEERAMAQAIPIESLLTDVNTSTNEYQGYIDLVCQELKEKLGVDPYSTPMLIYTNMVRKKQDGINKIMNTPTGKAIYSFKWKDDDMQAGIAVVNSGSGKIEAIGAGRNRTSAKSFSFATFDKDTQRQIGSTAKPLFDYGPGMEYNNWSTYTLFEDKAYTYSNGKPISNYDGKYAGTITLRYALSDSRNIPALKAFQQVDNKKIVDLVTTVGITPEISNGLIHEAHAIGAFTGSNPLTMAGAYQMFGNGGYYYEPFSVNKVIFRDDDNNTVHEFSSPKVKVISDSTAYMITDVLKSVLAGTVAHNGLPNDKFACKTGTTNLDSATLKKNKLPSNFVRDYWVMGYTHDITIAIWIGYEKINNKHYLRFGSDGTLRPQLLNAVARSAFNHDGKDFTMPKSVVKVGVEAGSNPAKLPSANTPSNQIKYELFKRGTEPTQTSTKYLSVSTPSNLTASYQNNRVQLSWTGVSDPDYVDDKPFGYYIYFNGNEIAFTQSTSYSVTNQSNYFGTYSVRAGYQGTTDGLSGEVTTELKQNVYKISVKSQSVTYTEGESINSSYYDGSMVVLTNNGTDVTAYAKITSTITDKSGATVSSISSSSPNTYTITYHVSYNDYSGSTSNRIIIKEKETQPEPQPQPESEPETQPQDNPENT